MLAQRICCWIVSNARCHTEAPLHQEATAEEIPPSEEAALGKGRSAGAGSRRTIVTLVGCRVLPWLAFIGSNCIFKAVWVPSPSATGLIDCRECVCGRGLLKAPPENISPARNPAPKRCGIASCVTQCPPTPPAARQLLLAQLFGASIEFLEDFTPHLQILISAQAGQRANAETQEPSLTGAGEVPALDGVACAGVHPARGLCLVAVKDKEWGYQHPWGPREPHPVAREGS